MSDHVDALRIATVRHAADNLGVRHRSGATAYDYLRAFLPIAREFAYATHDDSWGEFEKEFGHIVCRLIDAEAENVEAKRHLTVLLKHPMHDEAGMIEWAEDRLAAQTFLAKSEED